MNNTTTIHNMEPPKLESMQINLIRWIVSWIQDNKVTEGKPCDLPEVVTILQSLGYRIRRIDACDPDEVTPLENGEQGNRIIISCTYSGQRCYLECPQPQESCGCVKKPNDDTQNSFWEVSATGNNTKNSIIETGSDLLPNITKEVYTFIRSIVYYLIEVMHSSSSRSKDVSISVASEKKGHNTTTSSPVQNAKRLSAYMSELGDALNLLDAESPRYGSLDTLTQPSKDTPTNRPLVQSNKVNSTPNLSTTKEECENNSSTISNINDQGSDTGRMASCIQTAIENLQEVLSLVDTIKIPQSSKNKTKGNGAPKKVNRTYLTPSPRAAQSRKSPNGQKTSKLPLTPGITANRKIPVAKDTKATATATTAATSKTVQRKAISSTDGMSQKPKTATLATKTVPKKTSLYAHVKSTIPKTNITTKKT